MTRYIIIRRPSSQRDSSYLYNVILRNKEWKHVTMITKHDENMVKSLEDRGIWHLIGNDDGTGAVSTVDDARPSKPLLQDASLSISFLDSLLATVLTSDQVKQLEQHAAKLSDIERVKKELEMVVHE